MPILRVAGLQVPHFIVLIILSTFVALAIVLSRSRIAISVMILSVLFSIAGEIWRHEQQDILTDSISTLGQVLTQASLVWVVSSAVFGAGRITYHRILGAVVMYLGIGMIFTSLDMLLVRTVPLAFSHLPADKFDLLETMNYFSFSALTTGNFGDIVPVHPIARSLANLESIFGQLFPATLLARIVGLHGAKRG